MKTIGDIFSGLGGPSAVARMLGVRASTASEMKRRGSIPSEYWSDILRAAKARGLAGLDAQKLAELHARPRSVRRSQSTDDEAASAPPGDRAQDQVGHFSRFYGVRRPHFATADEIREHIDGLRSEWDRR